MILPNKPMAAAHDCKKNIVVSKYISVGSMYWQICVLHDCTVLYLQNYRKRGTDKHNSSCSSKTALEFAQQVWN